MARAGTVRHPQDGTAAARLGRRLGIVWASALAIVAAIVVVGGLWLERLDLELAHIAGALAEAAARRQDIKRIAASLPDLAQPEDAPAAIAELEDALAHLRESGIDTGDGTDAPSAGAAEPGAERHTAEMPAADGRSFGERLERVLSAVRAGEPPGPETLGELRREVAGPLLAASERGFARLAERRNALAARAHGARRLLLGGLLLTILAEALLLFRPLTRRLVVQASELERLARLDPTTGLLCRGAFLAALDRELATKRPLVLVLIDLDHFKEVNDGDGHAAGDTVLRTVAARMREVLRASDSIGRVGGDEFACLLPEVAGARPVETVVNRLRAALHEPVPFGDRLLRSGATLGIARYPDDARSADQLLRAADEALLRAKRNQRGGVGRASPDDAPRIERLIAALRALDQAGPEDRLPGLDAALQPIAVIAADPLDPAALLGFEALARWHHPTLGAIVPDELFPTAAATGRAARLGRAIRRRALAAFAGLGPEAIEGRYLAVNLAPTEVTNPDLEAELEADLGDSGLPWSALCLEITEQLLLDRVSDERLARLLRLHDRGVRLALDDFGTGSSGLAQLLRLPIDILKIDRRFVAAVTRDERAREIVRATLGLASGLGIEVIAEGIEEPAQAALLAQLGCRAGQGWLIGRPLQGEALQAFWRDRMRPAAENVVALRA